MENEKKERIQDNYTKSRIKLVAVALIPFVVLGAMIALVLGPGQQLINTGTPLPEVTIERIEFHESGGERIVVFIRNTGPIEVSIAQADVNDRIHPAAIEPAKDLPRLAESRVIIPFPWNVGEPYEIGITTSDGTRFSRAVEAAAPAPEPSVEQASFFALIGAYVGVIPVLIGLLWFPFIRRLSKNQFGFFLSLTAGLLVFLGLDALIEGNEIAIENVAGVFSGQILIAMVTILSFVALLYASEKLIERAKKKSAPVAEMASSSVHQQQLAAKTAMTISLMIAIGIGLHNFGEGLAIGAAVLLGQVALSTFLIVGFALHNTTEGLAIVAPMSRSIKIAIPKLVGLGMIAGLPTIAGTWIGGFLYSPIATIVFLSIGAGAIFQVVYSIYSWMKENEARTILSNASIIAGFAAGMLIMYITGLLIPS